MKPNETFDRIMKSFFFFISIRKFQFHFGKSPSNGHSIHPTKVWTKKKNTFKTAIKRHWVVEPWRHLWLAHMDHYWISNRKNPPLWVGEILTPFVTKWKVRFRKKVAKDVLGRRKNVPENSANFTMTTVQVWIINKIVWIGSGRKMVA